MIPNTQQSPRPSVTLARLAERPPSPIVRRLLDRRVVARPGFSSSI